jgi:hypothetical protein
MTIRSRFARRYFGYRGTLGKGSSTFPILRNYGEQRISENLTIQGCQVENIK